MASWARWSCWVLAFVAVGCTPDPSAHEAYVGCSVDTDCDDSLVCRRGFCVVDLDDPGSACIVGDQVLAHGERVSCYTGPAETRDVGACRSGEQECVNGVLTGCLGQVVPKAEACNGRDDDCDGVVDNIEAVACDTGLEGRCMEGRLACRGSLAVCEQVHEPRAERCNGLDDDCNGEPDDGVFAPCYPPGEVGCQEQPDGSFECEGICEAGVAPCVDGEFDLAQCDAYVLPDAQETCDGLDNTCTGVPDDDEECSCGPGDTQACYTGPADTRGEGACTDGVQTCQGGFFGPCEGAVPPEAETCANMDPEWEPGIDPADLDPQFDNDCNGIVDDVPNLGGDCTDEEALGVCRYGTMWCDLQSGEMVCETPDPLEVDVCDGTDRNCDGTVDTGFDLLTDDDHCGECNNACTNGLQCCQGACMDLQTSDEACGDCETVCGEGRTCCGGTCVNTARDDEHCGACGVRCGDGRTCCDGACVDVRDSTDHCGACGDACESDQVCCDGSCVAPGDPACSDCPMTCADGTECCDGSCVNLDTDTSHCGDCGDGCASHEICCGGDCVDGGSTAHCGSCDDACDSGQLCCGGDCVDSNAANCGSCGNTCGQDELCCDDECVSSLAEPNCGGCGVTCMTGRECNGGLCCQVGWTNCGGTCVHLDNDESHCGACGRTCSTAETCRDGCCCRGQSCRC